MTVKKIDAFTAQRDRPTFGDQISTDTNGKVPGRVSVKHLWGVLWVVVWPGGVLADRLSLCWEIGVRAGLLFKRVAQEP